MKHMSAAYTVRGKEPLEASDSLNQCFTVKLQKWWKERWQPCCTAVSVRAELFGSFLKRMDRLFLDRQTFYYGFYMYREVCFVFSFRTNNSHILKKKKKVKKLLFLDDVMMGWCTKIQTISQRSDSLACGSGEKKTLFQSPSVKPCWCLNVSPLQSQRGSSVTI